ncbi:hypothetical protein [uncultured Tenacibaculum sp.]|uniref:hypothetical protein n=1 Tax=uncultured Tenacibaculum sp. TaxID=174713 RepID=UPI00261E67D9|nr:hypothetical protein [uncultured Tenacibaculum sp.]
MIIKLDSSLINYCKLKTNVPSHIHFFELFAEIKLRGFHFVLAERDLLQVLGNLEQLSQKTRSIYRKLFQNYTTEKSIENNIDFSLRISSHKSQRSENCSNIFIDELDVNSFLTRNKLLMENTADADIYYRITDFYRKNNGMANIDFKWEPSNGGGSTTFTEYQRILNERLTFTYCIIDSDKKSPFSSIGKTALIFKKKPKNSAFGNHHVLEAHEMENLYPPSILLSMCSNNFNGLKKNYDIIEKMSRNKECSSFLYLDLKNGLNVYSLSHMKDESREYWENILNINKKIYNKCNCKDKQCKHFIIKPFGRKIGDNIIHFINSINLIITELLTDNYKILWQLIGKILFDRFCCPKFTVAV